MVYELGLEIHAMTEDDGVNKAPILEDELRVGQKVAIRARGFYHVMTVKEASGVKYASDGTSMAVLELAKDGRNCWLCVSIVDQHVREKITVETTLV